MSLSNEDLVTQAPRMIAKAWTDEGFPAALLAHPRAMSGPPPVASCA